MADGLEGKATHPGGRIKEGRGDLMADREILREGRLDQMEGRAGETRTRAGAEADEAATRREIIRRERDI